MTVLATGVPTDGDVVLYVDGGPVGKGRPRIDPRQRTRSDGSVQRARAFTPARTVRAENRVQLAWIEAGRPRLPDGPIALGLEIVVERPKSHWRRDGTLSAAGQRSHWPTGRPDLDNVLKLVGDALNEHAYKDDAAICRAAIDRRWANAGEHAHLVVRLAPAPVPALTNPA